MSYFKEYVDKGITVSAVFERISEGRVAVDNIELITALCDAFGAQDSKEFYDFIANNSDNDGYDTESSNAYNVINSYLVHWEYSCGGFDDAERDHLYPAISKVSKVSKSLGSSGKIYTLPTHWRTAKWDSLSDDQRDALQEAFNEAGIIDRDDPFYAFQASKRVLGDGAETRVDPYEGYALSTDSEIAVPSIINNTLKTSMFISSSRAEDRIHRDNISNVSNYFDYLRSELGKLPNTLLKKIEEDISNRLARKGTASIIEIIEQIKKEATIRFRGQIAAINEDPNSKWYIVPDGDTYTAITKDLIYCYGEDDSEVDEDVEWCMGFGRVVFDERGIRRIYVGGVGHVLDVIDCSPHPHLNYQGAGVFCSGNLAHSIIDSITGDAEEIAKKYSMKDFKPSEKLALENVYSCLSRDILNSVLECSNEIDVNNYKEFILDCSKLLVINDIGKYLNLAHSLLTSVDYDSPYVRLNECELTDRLTEYNDEKYDNGDEDDAWPVGCFSELPSEVTYVSSSKMISKAMLKDLVRKGVISRDTVEKLKDDAFTCYAEYMVMSDVLRETGPEEKTFNSDDIPF